MSEWRKSSHSQVGECAEVAQDDDRVLVRDSKDPGPVPRFSPAEWRAFLATVKGAPDGVVTEDEPRKPRFSSAI